MITFMIFLDFSLEITISLVKTSIKWTETNSTINGTEGYSAGHQDDFTGTFKDIVNVWIRVILAPFVVVPVVLGKFPSDILGLTNGKLNF